MSSYQYLTQTSPPKIVKPGQQYQCDITIKNTGTDTWQRDVTQAFRMGTQGPQDGPSGFYCTPTATTGWIGNSRIQLPVASVAPGATVTIPFTIQIPDQGGRFTQHFQFVVEGVQWLTGPDIYFTTLAPAKAGIFKFGWYGPGDYRWTQSDPGGLAYARDIPSFGTISGYYDSTDPGVIDQQLQNISNLGFDYVILDWWFDSDNYAHVQQAATSTISRIQTAYPNLQYSFVCEPQYGYNGPTGQPMPQSFYDWAYTTYGSDPQFVTHKGKKLIYTYYWRYPGSGDPRFDTQALSSGGRTGYADYWAVPPTITNGVCNIIHRFDNGSYASPGQPNYFLYNPSLDGDLFTQQKAFALSNRDHIDLLNYTSLNEYGERTNGPEVSADVRSDITNFLSNEWRK